MRAMILAAGMGTRLKPLTNNTPKGLVKVNGIPMVERQIQYLKESGIDEIIVVTGYLKEKFNYLKEEYGVTLIHNDKYDIYNNLYTMYLVRDLLPDSYVLESDIYMNKNVIDINIDKTQYFGSREFNFEKEWIFKVNKDYRIISMEMESSDDDIILKGISYWTAKDGKFISEKINEAVHTYGFDDLYLDDIVKDNIYNIDLYLNELDREDLFEIDSIADLKKVENVLSK